MSTEDHVPRPGGRRSKHTAGAAAPLTRLLVFVAAVAAVAGLLQPASAHAGYDASSVGTRSVENGVVIKTPAPPNVNIAPAPAEAQFYLTTKCPDLQCQTPTVNPPCPTTVVCGGCPESGCSSTNSSPSYCQEYRDDYNCTGYDPVDMQCDKDAETVAAHSWHADYGPTMGSWERWSSSCQSNWSAYSETDGGTITAWAQYGSASPADGYGVASTSYTVNGTYVYGQMLFGGQGTNCVTALGNDGYMANSNPAYPDQAGCV